VITNDGLNKLATEIDNFTDHGTYIVDGQKKDTPIYKVYVDGNKIRIFLYLSETEGVGTLSEFELIDEDGDVFAEKADSIEKGDLKGLLVAFDFNIQEV
jgi:hypothetical protein